MASLTRIYAPAETPSDEIPAGCERVSLVSDNRTGTTYYQIEKADGSFCLCDADGDVVTLGSWTLLRVLADVDGDDSDAFFEITERAAAYTVLFERGEGEARWAIEQRHDGVLCVSSNADTHRVIDPYSYHDWDGPRWYADLVRDGVPAELAGRVVGQAGLECA